MFQYTCLNPISKKGTQNFTADYVETDSLAQADAVLVRSAKMHDLEVPDRLLAVARAGAGVNNIPLQPYAEKGIVVFNTPGANANGVKEMVIAGMLLASRDIVGGIEWVRAHKDEPDIGKLAEKNKKQFAGNELKGKKLGIIGLGAIGQMVANTCIRLGMDVYGYDPYISVDAAWNLHQAVHHVQYVAEIYRSCDYITIHVPAMESTKGMISAEFLSMMKDGVVLLNFARDILVDEKALVSQLYAGKVRKYVTDFANETIANAPNVLITPHLGASTAESEDNCAAMAVSELRNFLENGNIVNSVNYPRCTLGPLSSPGRIGIFHKNVANMISKFANIFGEANVNILNMTNKSRDDYAYTLMDLEKSVDPSFAEKIQAIPGVIRVRIVR